MAFNFFGTFTTGQWEDFKAFSRIQSMELRLRKSWLNRELLRIGIFITTYDGPYPVKFIATGYAGKLLRAYRILGGVPEQTMLLRTRDKPVFKTRSHDLTITNESTMSGGFSDVYSNGRRERGTQRYDRDIGLKVESIKSWQLESIKFKRERLEFKIKRAMDYSDQIQQEIDKIDKLLSIGSGSFEDQIVSVDVLISRPESANVVQNLDDKFGLNIGKPTDFTFADALDRQKAYKERGT